MYAEGCWVACVEEKRQERSVPDAEESMSRPHATQPTRLMSKGCKRLFFAVIITILVISFTILLIESIFKIGYAPFATLRDTMVCEEVISPMGPSFESVNSFVTGEPKNLFLCGLLQTDGRPAKLTITVRNSSEELVYDHDGEYTPGNVYIPFVIPNGIEDIYTIQIFHGHDELVKTNITIQSPKP